MSESGVTTSAIMFGRRRTMAGMSPALESTSLVIFSGGTALNSICSELSSLTHRVCHVLPMSDDGGSSREIIRVAGGPAVGDIRSRCLRLSDESTPEGVAVKRLLGYRLGEDAIAAKNEWYAIVEGRHALWKGISRPYADTIRSFLVYFQQQILRHDPVDEPFNFSNGSVGNFFFSGSLRFFRSIEAAIFVYARVSEIHPASLVCPSIITTERLVLGAELEDKTILVGQNNISHPSSSKADQGPPISSRIKRIFYVSSHTSTKIHEVVYPANPVVLEQCEEVDAIVYGMGSLYTSLAPSLILPGVGETISRRGDNVPKILCLNATLDRETKDMVATDFILAVTYALNRKDSESLNNDKRNSDGGQLSVSNKLNHPPRRFINHLLAPKGGEIVLDEDAIQKMGIKVRWVESDVSGGYGQRDVRYSPQALVDTIRDIVESRSK